jgi:hypothetical protein
MRTTLTVEPDVAMLGSKTEKTYTHPVNTGVPLISLDDVSEALAFAEDEDYRLDSHL